MLLLLVVTQTPAGLHGHAPWLTVSSEPVRPSVPLLRSDQITVSTVCRPVPGSRPDVSPSDLRVHHSPAEARKKSTLYLYREIQAERPPNHNM